MLIWDDALGSELLDLRLLIALPVIDIQHLIDAHWMASVDDGVYHVIKVCAEDGCLVRSGHAGLLQHDKVCANPDCQCAVYKVSVLKSGPVFGPDLGLTGLTGLDSCRK